MRLRLGPVDDHAAALLIANSRTVLLADRGHTWIPSPDAGAVESGEALPKIAGQPAA